MDIISQLQEQVNTIAAITFNTFGSLQRDAPPVRLSSNYPEPVANLAEDLASVTIFLTWRSDNMQSENETIGKELQKQLEAAENELKLVQELFNQAADNCLNLKMLDLQKFWKLLLQYPANYSSNTSDCMDSQFPLKNPYVYLFGA